jgi:hypothetical protein
MQDDRDMKIGSVTLDLSQYSGNDLYCDGDDRRSACLRSRAIILRSNSERSSRRARAGRYLYHLSPLRENISRLDTTHKRYEGIWK